MKSGAVAIIGRPNVGKSTLLNALLGEKIAIVSDKPQTTRSRILGVVHRPDAEVVLLDTPGIHQARYELNKRMVRAAIETMRDADLLYVMVEATGPARPDDHTVFRQVQEWKDATNRPTLLLINKVDIVNKTRVLPLIDSYSRLHDWTDIVPLSALAGDNVARLMDLTVKYLPEGEAAYGQDVITDQTMRTLAAELIREKLLARTREEVPHALAVEIEDFKEEGKLARISATVLVEKESQKGIVVGKGGALLKAAGTEARIEMERLFGMKVFLQLWVKVREAWREDERTLAELGY